MGKQFQDSDMHRHGDKVRIRVGERRGERGVVVAEEKESLVIQIGANDFVLVPLTDVTNYSLAARRAWRTMPKRAGRPRLAHPRKKMISVRLDIDVWGGLGRAAESGLIQSREQAINEWLRDRLEVVLNRDPYAEQVPTEQPIAERRA